MTFTKESVRKLIESINVGSINESELEVLVNDTTDKLNESFKSAYEAGKTDGINESTETLRKERLESFKRGEEKGKKTLQEAVEKAEKVAFAAGHDKAILESEEEADEISKDILDAIEELCKVFDKYTRLVEIITHDVATEEVKESVTNALIQFCDRRVNESLPEKTIVNYHRLQQLEALNESIKKMYLINDIDVANAVQEAKESCAKEFNEAKEYAVNQTKKRIAAEQLLESVKAENYLLKRVRNLPSSDQKELLEKFRGASVDVIDESFEREYQRLSTRHAENIQKARVNDIVCESRLQKMREDRIRRVEESQKKMREEEQKALITESAENKAKNAYNNKMNIYVNGCKTLARNGL